LLEAVLRVGSVKRFVYASSSSIYGNVENIPISEEATPKPYSPYGVTKLTAEKLCRVYYENFNLPIVILRYFTVYGPRQRPDMAFHKFIKSMLKGEPICVWRWTTGERFHVY
jgi:UDP-glucose 4-epimerase